MNKWQRKAIDLDSQITELLTGKDSSIIGSVLANAIAVWILGHRPDVREELLKLHIGYVRNFMMVNHDCWEEIRNDEVRQ